MNDTDIFSRSIKEAVLQKIKPTPNEREHLSSIAKELMDFVNKTAEEQGLEDVYSKLVGSAARGTWVSGTHDLDIFITFPEETTRVELEKFGLSVARDVAKRADSFEERYAEHPYVNMSFQGFDVDLVPCFRVSSSACIKSAVDRTPFHNEFIKQNISGLEDDVLLLKQFMRGGGVYGSELRTQGFSGYLTELLIVQFGSFENVLKAACDWYPGIEVDIKDHGMLKHEDPLVVIDPTDPKRNVAAALSLDRFCEFIDMSRRYFEGPSENFFFKDLVTPITDGELIENMQQRGSSFLAIVFKTPDVVEDVLYPQLYKMEHSAASLLESNDFRVIKTRSWAGEECVILLELLSSQLPTVKKHMGPPVWSRRHAESFRLKYVDSVDVFSMYVEGGKYVVEIPRKFTSARDVIVSRLTTCSLGKHLNKAVGEGFQVLVDDELCRLDYPDLRMFFRKWV